MMWETRSYYFWNKKKTSKTFADKFPISSSHFKEFVLENKEKNSRTYLNL